MDSKVNLVSIQIKTLGGIFILTFFTPFFSQMHYSLDSIQEIYLLKYCGIDFNLPFAKYLNELKTSFNLLIPNIFQNIKYTNQEIYSSD
jgi:hypothetical protein